MNAKVFLDYDQEALDRAFDQKAWASNGAAMLEHYKTLGEQLRVQGHYLPNQQYGTGPDECLDIFPANSPNAPIHFHIHGGGWRLQRKEDASFAAAAITAAGTHYVVPDFSALPAVRLPQVVDQLARAIAWVYNNANTFRANRDQIHISGHSSGAHLCAVLLTLNWSKYGLPANVIKGGLCISGMYDMEPVLLSARRHYIQLSPDESRQLSPALMAASIPCPVTIVYATNDSPEFIRQAQYFAQAMAKSGKPCKLIAVPDSNHYEIIGQLPQLAQSYGTLGST